MSSYRSDSESMRTAAGATVYFVVFVVALATVLALYFAWIGPTFVDAHGRTQVEQAKVDRQVRVNSQGYIATKQAEMEKDLTDYLSLQSDIAALKGAGAPANDPQILGKQSQEKLDVNTIHEDADTTPKAVTPELADFLVRHPRS